MRSRDLIAKLINALTNQHVISNPQLVFTLLSHARRLQSIPEKKCWNNTRHTFEKRSVSK